MVRAAVLLQPHVRRVQCSHRRMQLSLEAARKRPCGMGYRAAWDTVPEATGAGMPLVRSTNSPHAVAHSLQRSAGSEEGRACMPALQPIDLLMLLAELRVRVIQLRRESAHLAAAKCGTVYEASRMPNALCLGIRCAATRWWHTRLARPSAAEEALRERTHGNHAQCATYTIQHNILLDQAAFARESPRALLGLRTRVSPTVRSSCELTAQSLSIALALVVLSHSGAHG